MKVQSHINIPSSEGWYRCREIDFDGEAARWVLSQSSFYTYFDAYKKKPHIQLIEATDDASLKRFVKAWGPLRGSLDGWEGVDPIQSYRDGRDKLIAIVQLLASVEDRGMRRMALLGLSEFSKRDADIQMQLRWLRKDFVIPGRMSSNFDEDLQNWMESASQNEVDSAVALLVSNLPVIAFPTFSVQQASRKSVLSVSLGLLNLGNALHWMVWQDVFQNHPFQFCEECRELFQPEGKYVKKYCSKECAHRKTAREFARKKRNERKDLNGTQKTR